MATYNPDNGQLMRVGKRITWKDMQACFQGLPCFLMVKHTRCTLNSLHEPGIANATLGWNGKWGWVIGEWCSTPGAVWLHKHSSIQMYGKVKFKMQKFLSVWK